jgi:Flp pilus assembly pilin Flp
MNASFVRLVREDQAQNLVEYALIAGLVALVVLAAVSDIGSNVSRIYAAIRDSLAPVAP